MINEYVVIDVETTGLHPRSDRIIEIGMLKVKEGQVVATYETLVNPAMEISAFVTGLTGITQEELTHAPYIQDVIEDIIAFAEDLPIMGHQISFDYAFVKKAAVQNGFRFEKSGIDTLKLARKYATSVERKTLESLCTHYGIEHTAHRAKGDALATHMLYEKLLEEYPGAKEEGLVQLQYQVKKESPITKRQIERLQELITRHDITFVYELEKLTKNEGSRFIDQILATYGR